MNINRRLLLTFILSNFILSNFSISYSFAKTLYIGNFTGSSSDTVMTATPSIASSYNTVTVNLGSSFLNTNICTSKTIFGLSGSATCGGLSSGNLDLSMPFSSGHYSSMIQFPVSSQICTGTVFLGNPGTAICKAGSNITMTSSSEVLNGKIYWDNSGIPQTGSMNSHSDIWDVRSSFPGLGKYSQLSNMPTSSQYCNSVGFLGTPGSMRCQVGSTSNLTTNANISFLKECWDSLGAITTGTMINRATWNLTSSIVNQAIFPGEGYYSNSSLQFPSTTQICTGSIIGGITGTAGCQYNTSSSVVQPSYVMSSYQYWDGLGTFQVGTMSNYGSINLNTSQIPNPSSGYYTGFTSNLNANEICSTNSILGVTGSVTCLTGVSPSHYEGGYYSSCGVVNGSAHCRGNNHYGQLGNGTLNSSAIPTTVLGLTSHVKKISMGGFHACALVNGGVQCWGHNPNGQLGYTLSGYPVLADQLSPVLTTGLTQGTNVTDIQSGMYHNCATVNGGLKCWGLNSSGQLGNGSLISVSSPVSPVGLTANIQSVQLGYYHSCALINGGLACWGDNTYGQLGNNNAGINALTPTFVSTLTSGVQDYTLGNNFTCALLSSGSVQCWGKNTYGELGTGSTTSVYISTPVMVSGLTAGSGVIKLIKKSSSHNCALMSSGNIKCWGYNNFGQLGNYSTTNSLTPTPVQGITNGATDVFGGGFHTCAKVYGQIQCWGNNSYGQLGVGLPSTSPTPNWINSF